jgi:hypothetical protein
MVFQIIASDSVSFLRLYRSRTALAAENLFLREQLILFQEREKRARPTTAAVALSANSPGWQMMVG